MRGKIGSGLFHTELPIGEKEEVKITRAGKKRAIGIAGVEKILLYDPGKMRFRLKEEEVEITGSGLAGSLFDGGYIRIEGHVTSVAFYARGDRG